MCWFTTLIGVVLAWLVKAGLFLGVMATGLGCSLAASWSAPSQQQVHDPQQPVTQTVSAESPQTVAPEAPEKPVIPLVPGTPTGP